MYLCYFLIYSSALLLVCSRFSKKNHIVDYMGLLKTLKHCDLFFNEKSQNHTTPYKQHKKAIYKNL